MGRPGGCSTVATTFISSPGPRLLRRSPTCCSAGRRQVWVSWAATAPNWPSAGPWAELVSSMLPQIAASQGPMEAMRSLVSLASADDPDESSTRRRRTSGRRPGSPRSNPSWSPPITPPAKGVSACPLIPASAWRPTSCSSCVARPRRCGMLRSWTRAWCCTRTTR